MIGRISNCIGLQKLGSQRGCIAQRQHACFSSSSPGFESQRSRSCFRGIIIDVSGLIISVGKRKVDIGLKMLIKPIQFWLVASQYYKKASAVPRKAGNAEGFEMVQISRSSNFFHLKLLKLLHFVSIYFCKSPSTSKAAQMVLSPFYGFLSARSKKY